MQTKEQKLNKLKKLIKAELDLCDYKKTPTICKIADDPDQYPGLENKIVKHIINTGSTIGQALVTIEKELNINMTID